MISRLPAPSPTIARVAPFAVFALLTSFQGYGPETAKYWIYAAKTVLGAGLLWWVWPVAKEMRWTFSWAGLLVGVVIAGLWIGLEPFYPHFGRGGKPWNPFADFGERSALAWFFVSVRLLAVTLVVPPLEEVFYRSFLYRYISKPDFESVPLKGVRWPAFLITAALFGAAHPGEWLPGMLCGAAYQALVCWKGRLGDAILAHAVTNLILGIYVVSSRSFQFW
ncbi:MAG TPA: CAAX prenyl protease-related protein [Methylomirabilota bacterium]|nr:CAAX prenyl protease-related protein [Methylomirabilota bacterium]